MRVWHRLHVFARFLIVLCVIVDAVPVVEYPSLEATNSAASSPSDKSVDDESWRTREYGITGNFEETTIAEEEAIVSTIPSVPDDLSTAEPDVTRGIETFVETSTATIEPKKKTDRSMHFEAREMDLIAVDFDNSIDTTGEYNSYTEEHSTFFTTEKPEAARCVPLENYSTTTSADYSELDATTIYTVDDDKDRQVAVEDLKILESTTESLKVSWKRPKITTKIQHYDVQWHQKDTLIGACRMLDDAMHRHALLVESLNACTAYHVTVLPVLESAIGAVATVNGTTDLEVNDRSVKLGIADVGNEWIEISWTMPCTDCVSHYILNVCGSESCVEAKIDKTTYNKTDLEPGTSYNFELTIEGSKGSYGSINVTGATTVPKPEIKECDMTRPIWSMNNYLEGNSPAIFQNVLDPTPSTMPHSKTGEIIVEDLQVVGTVSTALTVSWKRPNGTLDVSYYVIEWYKDDDQEITTCRVSNTTFIYVITSLVPCTTYTVKVMPHLEAANGTRRVVSGTTGLNIHKDTLNLKVAANGTDWLKITWNMPSTDCVTHYVVTFCDRENCTEHKTNNTTYYEKKGLRPCLTYDFKLTVYGSMGAYGSLNVSGTTAFLAPGQPSPATTVSGNHSLLVSWPKPVGYTCVKYYRVVWSRNNKNGYTDTTTDNSLKLLGLEPCATYEIIVTAVNIKEGDSLQEIITSNSTAPAVMEAPVMLSGPSVTQNEISMNWEIRTDETNNCVPATLIVECKWKKTLGSGYKSIDGRSEYNIAAATINQTIDTTVKNISPFTKYDCQSYVYNFGGRSEGSKVVSVDSLEAVPSAPKLLPESESNVTNTSITLQWRKPSFMPGILRDITILVIWQYGGKHRPDWCVESVGTENITDIDTELTSYVYSHATPYSVYRIKIAASTGAGWGPASEPQKFQTKPGAPGKVSNLSYELHENSEDPNELESTLKWGIPCFFNGNDIEYFHVLGIGNRDGFEEHIFSQNFTYTSDNCLNDVCSLIVEELRDEYTYDIEVAAKVEDYNDLGERSKVTVTYPAGIPPQPDDNYTSIISIDPYKARRTTTTATVLLPLFPDTSGEIKCYAIIVSKIGHNNASFGRLKDKSGPPIATWKESSAKDFEIAYQATKFSVHSMESNIVDYGRFKALKFVLGEDVSCPEISSNKDERSYCNGPLNPDMMYHVRMRAFTSGGYRDSIVFTVKTNAELQVAMVIGTILGILFLGILITMMLLVRKCSLQAVLRRFLHSDMPGSPVPAPFTKRKFVAHCQQLADNPGKLSNEFQLLQTLSVDLQMPTNAAGLQANRKKNRYTDILPYDFSRVKLEVIDNDPNTDYINASFIKGFAGEEDYIACQGPKEETTYDFWRMIDQYDVKLIVMLTQLVEKNKEKCHQYFPTIRETFTYENMAIRCSMELDYKTYTQRTLVLQKENAKRNIIHLHFKDWPDHDVPEDFDPMINFCQIMRRHMEASRGLVVIHCSAGIGRTGTLIAIDILLQHIKDNRKLDVFGTVYRLRHHRINMVQRESQYAYIYNCIRQVLKNPYFSKTYKPPSVDPICDNSHKKKEASESNTDLVSSFETLKKSSFSTSVESAEPIYQSPSKSSTKSRTCYSFNGLRCTKSTGAIDTRPYRQSIGRYNTHDHPISEIANHDVLNSSEFSLEITDSEGSTTSIYENMQTLTRSKSAQAFERDEDPCVTQKLLEHDTLL